MASAASFNLVKTELESTVLQAQKSIESFMGNPKEIQALEESINSVNQARGIMVMLEDSGAAMMLEELANLLNELPAKDIANKTARGKSICEAITGSLVILSRYLEYKSINTHSLPELLLSSINSIRKARSLTVIRESQFYNYRVKAVTKEAAQDFRLSKATLQKMRQYRYMYQAALLYLIRGMRTKAALKYMAQALNQADKLSGNSPIAPLFWVGSGALEAMVEADAHVGDSRKMICAQLERVLSSVLKAPKQNFQKQPPTDLIKDLLYIIALCQPKNGRAAKVRKHYLLPPTRFSESFINEQRDILFSPGASVMNSVSDALKEEMNQVKSMVDSAAKGANTDFSAKALYQALNKISDILSMVGLTSPSNVLKTQAKLVGDWADNAAPSDDQLLAIADAVLYAEGAVSRLTKGVHGKIPGAQSTEAAKMQLQDARIVLIDEAVSGVTLAKRAVTAFIDSEGEIMHLSNLKATLKGVEGAFTFLNSSESAEIISKCINLVETKLLTKKMKADDDTLEYFADALSSLEFYLDALLIDEHPDSSILKVAKEAAAHL